jgi:CO/xanthine dehydrogenase FAD-binding subunit
VRQPTRAEACEDWLVGQLLADAAGGLAEQLDREIQAELSTPRFSVAYRQRLLSGLARRALSNASKEAPHA